MPVENENKYVLSDTFAESNLKDWKPIKVRQGYLDNGPRLRQYGEELLFTYKRWVGEKLVEIETPLAEEDFDALWPECGDLINKQRYVMHEGDLEWVVDFFKDEQGETYFIMAEVEMPDGMDDPETIPDEIKDHILGKAPKGDVRYTSQKLSDKGHASQLLNDLKR